MAYQNLFNLLSEQYNLNLLESELQEIIRAVHQDKEVDNQTKQLKDMFAAHAMQSFILKGNTPAANCKKAYQYAEEMIKQRNNINI